MAKERDRDRGDRGNDDGLQDRLIKVRRSSTTVKVVGASHSMPLLSLVMAKARLLLDTVRRTKFRLLLKRQPRKLVNWYAESVLFTFVVTPSHTEL